MKTKNLEKLGENLFKIFVITVISILCLVLLYASIKWTYNYFTMNDEQICKDSNAILINGQCHSECDRPVEERRNMLLLGGIAFPIIAVLLVIYLIVVLKKVFKK